MVIVRFPYNLYLLFRLIQWIHHKSYRFRSDSIQDEEVNQNKGHLKIFFGYAAGVGKTYAMLEAAHIAKKQGIGGRRKTHKNMLICMIISIIFNTSIFCENIHPVCNLLTRMQKDVAMQSVIRILKNF